MTANCARRGEHDRSANEADTEVELAAKVEVAVDVRLAVTREKAARLSSSSHAMRRSSDTSWLAMRGRALSRSMTPVCSCSLAAAESRE